VDSVFALDLRLPDVVFKKPGPKTLFAEFEVAMSGAFWPVIQAMARACGDESVHILVLDPEPEHYYLQHYGKYEAATIRIDASEGDYWDLISEEPSGDPTGAIVFSANVVAIVGDSGRWGCWGEKGLEVMAIQGLPEKGNSDLHIPLLAEEEAIDTFVALSYWRSSVPPELASALKTNYGTQYRQE
jgi:hypothetical protein